ncbi:hypothetical protein C8F01DRAFT_1263641 [Mycena amicta]|nr:hypothetical protein C8F01DRAFT_1263641 [Mycena amicta]
MSILPNAGIPAPIPDTFDFEARITLPTSLDPTARTLKLRNTHNLRTEALNEALYAYTADEIEDMVLGEAYCTAVVRQELDNDKADKPKTRPLLGSMVLVNPTAHIPGQQASVTIPDTMLYSIQNKLYVPLNWLLNERLKKIQHCLHELPTKLVRPEPSTEFPNPDKVLTFDMAKMMLIWGSDEDHTCLTPLKWQECARNLEHALVLLCGAISGDPLAAAMFAGEFKKHRLFFINYAKFEENFCIWYTFEREACHKILKGVLFDGDYYAHQVDGCIHAKAALELYSS